MPARSTVTPLVRTVRDRHLSLILRSLQREPLPRNQLAQQTMISFRTVTRLVARLLAAGIIVELPVVANTARSSGRPPIFLAFPERGRVVIGVHIRADTTTVAVYDLTGTRVGTEVVEHPDNDPEHVLAVGVDATRRQIDRVGANRVVAVGVSTGGVVDFEAGTVISSPRLGWTDVALRDRFECGTGLPVIVDNSVRALAISQLQQSAGQESSLLVVFVGAIVSSALIIDGQLYRGPGATAGTIAHLPVPDGPGITCPCGARDCLGVVVTDRALLQQAITAGALPDDAEWRDVWQSDSPAIVALRGLRAVRLGTTVGHMAELVNPDCTVVAGRIGSPADVDRCLAAISDQCPRGLGPRSRPVQHLPVTDLDWDRASAALAIDDYVRHATRYEPELLDDSRL